MQFINSINGISRFIGEAMIKAFEKAHVEGHDGA